MGGWLADRRKEVGFDALPMLTDDDFDSIKITGKRKIKHERNKNIAAHIAAWEAYKAALSQIKVLDPACGSGAFLNEVFDYLKKEGQTINNELARLTGEQTDLFRWDTHILANNIYGVDLNRESVEITKLSLWLKTANRNEKLTYLENNIKVGNSLIDDPAIAGDLAFDWHKEFLDIMNAGGFDVVVGNPPYVFARNQGFTEPEKQYYYKIYKQASYQINTYALFVEKAHNVLKSGGYKGYILPNTWLTISSFKEFRKFVLEYTSDTKIININDQVFSDASVDCCILLFKKENSNNVLFKGTLSKQILALESSLKSALDTASHIINLSADNAAAQLLNKINQQSKPLGEIALVTTGLKAYQTGKGSPKQTEQIKNERAFHAREKRDHTYIQYLEGRDVQRYSLGWSGEYLSYGDWLAETRKSVKFDQDRILVRQIPSKPPHSIEACFAAEPFLNDINSMVIQADRETLYKVLPVINSKLMTWWFIQSFDKFQRKTFPQFKVNELKIFPFPAKEDGLDDISKKAQKISENLSAITKVETSLFNLLCAQFSISQEKNFTRGITNYNASGFLAIVEKLLHPKKLTLAQKSEWMQYFEAEKAKVLALKAEVDRLDAEIDKMVYVLYGLTPDEISIVEGNDK